MVFFYWIELLFGMEVAFDFLNKSCSVSIKKLTIERREIAMKIIGIGKSLSTK